MNPYPTEGLVASPGLSLPRRRARGSWASRRPRPHRDLRAYSRLEPAIGFPSAFAGFRSPPRLYRSRCAGTCYGLSYRDVEERLALVVSLDAVMSRHGLRLPNSCRPAYPSCVVVWVLVPEIYQIS